MARRIVSDDVIADEILERLRVDGVRYRWEDFAISDESPNIETAVGYIIKYEPELSEWLEIFFPYMEKRLNNTLIDDVIKDFFGDFFYRENVIPF